MPFVFHQNMRVFGGNSAVRNTAFGNALNAVRLATFAAYRVMGFTELANAGPVMRGTVLGLAQTLHHGINRVLFIEAGRTAVGNRSEYIGIAWRSPSFTVLSAGRVLYRSDINAWSAYNVAAPGPANRVIPLPVQGGLAADSRGLAYIAGTYLGNPRIFGFMHNMYMEGNRSGAFSNLANMARRIRNALGGVYAAAEVIIGGDFNVRPRAPTPAPNLVLVPIAQRVVIGGAYVNTTHAHPYDFWLVDNPLAINDGNARVRLQTRVVNCSDHAGIDLQF